MSEPHVIDPQWFDSMSRTKGEFLKRLFGVFVAEEPARVAKIRAAFEAGDLPQARYLSHSLKGAAATMGAERVRGVCYQLECAARDARLDGVDSLLSLLETEMEQVFLFMTAFLNKE